MRPLLISKAWVQAAILVFLFGFFVLGLLALRTYQEQPPIPEKVVGPARQGDVRIQVAFGSGVILSVFLAHREWRRVRAVRTALFGPG